MDKPTGEHTDVDVTPSRKVKEESVLQVFCFVGGRREPAPARCVY